MTHILKTDIPVLMFYNIEFFEWTEKDRCDVLELVQVLKNSLEELGHPVKPLQLEDTNIPKLFENYDPKKYIVFNWCEGIPGIPHSFSKAARALEDLGFNFTGSTSAVLELNDDKRLVKKILNSNSVNTPRWIEYKENKIDHWNLYPSIVKPAFEHCSVGISPESIVDNRDELIKRAEYISEKFKQPIIIEEYIGGREFQVGVWGNENIEVLPPVESDFSQLENPRDHICTMDSKDDPSSYRYQKWNMIVPAILSTIEKNKINQLCMDAYQAIGVRDYARMDIRYGNGGFYLLDVNTNPYIGPECGLIQAAKIAGYSYGEFASQLINFGWQRMNSQS
jgi:D-alanine-D-alanine ligase